jgi:hypothetical protein
VINDRHAGREIALQSEKFEPSGGGSVIRRSSGCTCVSAPAPMHPLAGLLLVAPALVLVRRRLSGPRKRRS